MKKEIQRKLNGLSDLCLLNTGNYEGYEDKDLFNASLVFSNILLDVTYSENKYLSDKGKLEMAEVMGKAIRELIMSCTDKDMHIITEELLKKENEKKQ